MGRENDMGEVVAIVALLAEWKHFDLPGDAPVWAGEDSPSGDGPGALYVDMDANLMSLSSRAGHSTGRGDGAVPTLCAPICATYEK